MHSVIGYQTKKSQSFRLQNYTTETILGRNKYDGSTLARHQLHCLPVEERIKFKLLILVYKCLNDKAPLYLQNWWNIKHQRGILNQAGKDCLKSPKTNAKLSWTNLVQYQAQNYGINYLLPSGMLQHSKIARECQKSIYSSKHMRVSSSIINLNCSDFFFQSFLCTALSICISIGTQAI